MYQQYTTDQVILPIDLEIILPKNDIVFAIRRFVKSMPEAAFEGYHQPMGRPSYHPRMMFGVLLCAYAQGVTSGRKIEALLQDSIRMRWLTQAQFPDFRTINRFRIHPLMDQLLETAFLQFRNCLLKSGLITGRSLFIDGTKIEADANKYTFVWKKSVQKYEEALDKKASSAYRELVSQEILPELIREMADELSADDLQQIHQLLAEKETALQEKIAQTDTVSVRKELRQEKSQLHQATKQFKDSHERKEKYRQQKKTSGERNSYSKTDPDATFMRMKEDHMKNGQLKAGYNIQLATEKQFALAYDVYPNPTDTRTLLPFLKTVKKSFDLPEHLIADAGYGSEETYQHLFDQEECLPLIPYGSYHKEQKKKFKNDPFQRANWPYDATTDVFVCPNHQQLRFRNESKRKDQYGFERYYRVYECEDCSGCPLRSQCTKTKEENNRCIYLNPHWEELKLQVQALLKDEKLKLLYQQRKTDVEPVFGSIKQNMNFTRFHVRGKEKVHRETGLVFLAHNFRKLIARVGKYEGKQLIQQMITG